MGSITPFTFISSSPTSSSSSSSSSSLASPTSSLPYWQTNLPPSHLPTTCPPFLLHLSQKDQSILHTPDSHYKTLTWPSVRQIVLTNRLDLFQRRPSDLRLYLEYCYDIKQHYGSMMRYILDVKLRWSGIDTNINTETVSTLKVTTTFQNANNLKILRNDWPYGIDEKIIHLVVWTKFALEDDAVTGDTREDVRREIEGWVEGVFGKRCGRENVIWFRNWKSLKSVHAVEHFHVMLYDPDPEFVEEVTMGGVSCREVV